MGFRRRGTILKTGLPPEQIGVITANDFDALNWSVVGSPNASFSSSGITFATKAVSLDEYIYHNSFNNTDNVTLYARIEILANNPFFHFGFVGRGQVGGGADVGWCIQFNGATSAIIFQHLGKAGGALSYTSTSSAVVGAINMGDVLEITIDVIGSLISVNFTKNGATTNIQYNALFYNFGGFSINSLVTPIIMNIQCSMKVTAWTISSTSYKNYRRLSVGDSITKGYNAGSLSNRFAIVNGMEINAGGGNTTQDLINNINEVLLMNPNKVFLLIGLNDKAFGILDPTWQANYQTIVNTLSAAGITVISLLYAGWGANGVAVNAFISANYPTTTIDTATPLETAPGVINPIYDAGDGHPNAAGNTLIANIIANSPLY